MASGKGQSSGEQDVGALLERYFSARGVTERPQYRLISKWAGLDRLWAERNIPTVRKVKRGTLLKISAALDLTADERTDLAEAAGLPAGSLRKTEAEQLVEPSMSMRRAVILLTAPTDPRRSPFKVKLPGTVIRSGVVFGWHDVVTRVTTAPGDSVLDYAERLFNGGKLRSVETIPLRDDLPIYVDREFSSKGLHDDDYFWAVIFAQALSTPAKPEIRKVFRDVSQYERFRGGIHLLTAGVAVGQFDTMVEVLAANLPSLQEYVREAQGAAREKGREVHTVTYVAPRWAQRPEAGGAF